MFQRGALVVSVVLAVGIAICMGCISSVKKDEALSSVTKELSGTWKTNWVDLFLTQSGTIVTGSYDYKGGKLEGTIVGNRLDYKWTQNNGKKGKGYFIISDDGKSISGRYGYNDDNASAGEWTGRKVESPLVPAE